MEDKVYLSNSKTNKQKSQRGGKQGKRDKKTVLAYIKYNPISNLQIEERRDIFPINTVIYKNFQKFMKKRNLHNERVHNVPRTINTKYLY